MKKWQLLWQLLGIVAIVVMSSEVESGIRLLGAFLLGAWISWTGNKLFN